MILLLTPFPINLFRSLHLGFAYHCHCRHRHSFSILSALRNAHISGASVAHCIINQISSSGSHSLIPIICLPSWSSTPGLLASVFYHSVCVLSDASFYCDNPETASTFCLLCRLIALVPFTASSNLCFTYQCSRFSC
ncbi:hypothetical protein IW262DRAFT_814742 [Armillaria fumosa]|nr:hypothetical protein IW262DRAFT_814742 [Armillaria fumosa]